MVVVEMNPRVSRSSALASKATGFPIAKIAALLAVGYTLDEIPNDITRKTRAAFEPSLDYVVVKIPRWAFEKFPAADFRLSPQMKSVGEAMALGRTFPEALQKAIRSLEIGRAGLGPARPRLLSETGGPRRPLRAHARTGSSTSTRRCSRAGRGTRSPALTQIDPWFLDQMAEVVRLERRLTLRTVETAIRGRASWPRPSAPASRTGSLPGFWGLPAGDGRGPRCAPAARTWASSRSTIAWIPAPPSSRPSRPTCTPPTRPSARPSPPPARRS